MLLQERPAEVTIYFLANLGWLFSWMAELAANPPAGEQASGRLQELAGVLRYLNGRATMQHSPLMLAGGTLALVILAGCQNDYPVHELGKIHPGIPRVEGVEKPIRLDDATETQPRQKPKSSGPGRRANRVHFENAPESDPPTSHPSPAKPAGPSTAAKSGNSGAGASLPAKTAPADE